jgi:hypothetical protein
MGRSGWAGRRVTSSLRDRGRSGLSLRGYLVWAGVFAVMALISVWKLLTPGHNAFFAASAIVSSVLWVGILVAGFTARRQQAGQDRSQSRP